MDPRTNQPCLAGDFGYLNDFQQSAGDIDFVGAIDSSANEHVVIDSSDSPPRIVVRSCWVLLSRILRIQYTLHVSDRMYYLQLCRLKLN